MLLLSACLIGLGLADPEVDAVVSAAPRALTLNLSSWMGDLMPIIGNQSLMDLSLPGTHDTLTYDLSNTVADSANDLPTWVSWLLHTFKGETKFIGDFIKLNAETQILQVREQLENGARFLDLRQIYSLPPDRSVIGDKDWYSLHMVESNQKMSTYLGEVKDFLVSNPSEAVVIFLSRHGSEARTGNDQYPDVPVSAKQAWWAQIKTTFGNLLFDSAGGRRVNETTLSQLVESGRRAVVYAADYAEFTGNDSLAIDAAKQFSNGGDNLDLTNISGSLTKCEQAFAGFAAQRAEKKAQDTFFLVSMAGAIMSKTAEYSAEIEFDKTLHLPTAHLEKKCAESYNIPNMTSFCPIGLLENERLRNYYNQLYLDKVATEPQTYSPPGAIYLDVLGPQGTIRTDAGDSDAYGYAYADTLILWSARAACARPGADVNLCKEAEELLQARRAKNPLRRWSDDRGRQADWPV